MKLTKIILVFAIMPLFAFLSGCAAIATSVAHGDLQIKTNMSRSIFLDPVPDRKKVVYVQVRNTTARPSLRIRHALVVALEDKGYRVTNHFQRAYYVLQVNLLRMGKTSQTAAEQMMGNGYGGAMEGAAAGALIAGASGNDPVAGGIIGGVAGAIINNSVRVVTFYGMSDVKITVRSHPSRVFRTRIMSTANQVNLRFEDALPRLKQGLVRSIAGIF